MTDYEAEYKAAMAEFQREEQQLNMFLRGLLLLGWIGVIAVVVIGIAYG